MRFNRLPTSCTGPPAPSLPSPPPSFRVESAVAAAGGDILEVAADGEDKAAAAEDDEGDAAALFTLDFLAAAAELLLLLPEPAFRDFEGVDAGVGTAADADVRGPVAATAAATLRKRPQNSSACDPVLVHDPSSSIEMISSDLVTSRMGVFSAADIAAMAASALSSSWW